MQRDENNGNKLPVLESDIRQVGFDDRLSDLIGERYQQWKTGELIFIHASTTPSGQFLEFTFL